MRRERYFHAPSMLLTHAERVLYATDAGDSHSPLRENGFIKLGENFLSIANIKPADKRVANDYLFIDIYNEDSLFKIAGLLLQNDIIKHELYKSFGMKFSVDYIYSSEINSVPDSLRSIGYYANHFHRDLMFSYNTVKVFVALDSINQNQGPTQWFSRQDSERLITSGFDRKIKYFDYGDAPIESFTGNVGDSIMMMPRSNIHRAGVPEAGCTRRQMMFQLNPARDWSFHSQLYKRQFAGEPNLPTLRNIRSRLSI